MPANGNEAVPGARERSDALARRDGAGPEGMIELLLRRAFESGAREYGPLPLSLDAFTRRTLDLTRARLVRSGLPCSPERISEVLERAAGADLYLSIACEEGIGGGWEAFTARFLPRVKALALWHGASQSEAEELTRELPGHLAASPRGNAARTRLGTYNGAAPLFDWLAVIVVQRLTDRRRARRRDRLEPAGGNREPASVGGDPADQVLDDETAERLEEALRRAWTQLGPKESAALCLKFKEGLPQKAIATLFGVGEPQVSKILKTAVEKVRAEIERHLRESSLHRAGNPDGLWGALRDALARHLERSETLDGSPFQGSSPHGPRTP
jgi:RNA polymerase sigma-70 factor